MATAIGSGSANSELTEKASPVGTDTLVINDKMALTIFKVLLIYKKVSQQQHRLQN
jgi:hypothetical protein